MNSTVACGPERQPVQAHTYRQIVPVIGAFLLRSTSIKQSVLQCLPDTAFRNIFITNGYRCTLKRVAHLFGLLKPSRS